MIRRVLLTVAAAAAAVVLSAPAAQADEICMVTVILTGTVDETVRVLPCMDYDHAQLCGGSSGIGPAIQKVGAEVCLPQPTA